MGPPPKQPERNVVITDYEAPRIEFEAINPISKGYQFKPSVGTPSAWLETVGLPSKQPAENILMADYEAPRNAFESLLRRDSKYRILLIRGPNGGSGKTTLLRYCRQRVSQSALHVPIELRDSMVNVADIFWQINQVIGWDHLPRFTSRLTALALGGEPDVKININVQAGFNNSITMVLRADNQLDRGERSIVLTNAWFDDISALADPVVMLFDTYEDAPTEVKGWINGPFLARAATTGSIRVVIAGRDVPERNNIAWGHCCQVHDLFGVVESKHWMPVVRKLHRRIPVPDPDSWLAGVCHALDGNPKQIMQVIEGLPLGGHNT